MQIKIIVALCILFLATFFTGACFSMSGCIFNPEATFQHDSLSQVGLLLMGIGLLGCWIMRQFLPDNEQEDEIEEKENNG